MINNQSRGIITAYALVFGAIFLLLLGGLLGFILLQLKQSSQKLAWNESLQIAEAGANYYRWCLNNEAEANCLTEKDYFRPGGGNAVGKFSLQINSTANCGEIVKRVITSTGWTYDFPTVKRQVQVLYAKTSVAKYAYLLNDNVWAGEDRKIGGPYHSNGGVRMDGENKSLVTSSNDNWICTSAFGCSTCPTSDGCWTSGPNCVCPGVFTTTANSDTGLFDFPVPPFDFNGITVDLAQMKSAATSSGVYLPYSTDIDSNGKGYHVKFKNDGSFEVWVITDLGATRAYSSEEGYHWDYFTINSEYLYNTYPINSGCSIIFIEDNLWVDGQVKGKVTIASADLIDTNNDTSVVLPGDITYTSSDGSDGLSVIAEKNVLISPDSPNYMELRGIFIAQKGHFGRNWYSGNVRQKLEIYGSVISNGRVGTQWTDGTGYLQRENYFDSNLIYDPPPFVPSVETDFKIVNWEEIE